MSPIRKTAAPFSRPPRLPARSGKMRYWILAFLIPALLITGIVVYGWQKLSAPAKIVSVQKVKVQRGTFVHEILERGSIESASNVEVRCQVESAGGLTIIFVVEEGTSVKKGDLLVELDSSTLNENVIKQRIAVNTSLSKKAQSEADLKKAELSLIEYIGVEDAKQMVRLLAGEFNDEEELTLAKASKGKFAETLKTIENKITTAKEDERYAADMVKYNERLLRRNFIATTEAETALYNLEKAKNALDVAELEKHVLENYTFRKNIIEYKADIDKAKATLANDTESWKLDVERLEHLENQLAKCKIFAPQDGQVIYFLRRWGGEEDMIKEGKMVFERQILLRLPDLNQMQVKGLINEANIRLVKVGQKATIRLEAFPNREFEGEVRTVNEYPEQGGWMGGTMSKEYQTLVRILDAPEGIKPGLTAEASIVVNEIPDALLLPVQAVFEYRKQTYCATYNDGHWEMIPVEVGPTNDKQIVILGGLEEGTEVVLGAWQHRKHLNLEEETPSEDGENGNGGPNGNRPSPPPPG